MGVAPTSKHRRRQARESKTLWKMPTAAPPPATPERIQEAKQYAQSEGNLMAVDQSLQGQSGWYINEDGEQLHYEVSWDQWDQEHWNIVSVFKQGVDGSWVADHDHKRDLRAQEQGYENQQHEADNAAAAAAAEEEGRRAAAEEEKQRNIAAEEQQTKAAAAAAAEKKKQADDQVGAAQKKAAAEKKRAEDQEAAAQEKAAAQKAALQKPVTFGQKAPAAAPAEAAPAAAPDKLNVVSSEQKIVLLQEEYHKRLNEWKLSANPEEAAKRVVVAKEALKAAEQAAPFTAQEAETAHTEEMEKKRQETAAAERKKVEERQSRSETFHERKAAEEAKRQAASQKWFVGSHPSANPEGAAKNAQEEAIRLASAKKKAEDKERMKNVIPADKKEEPKVEPTTGAPSAEHSQLGRWEALHGIQKKTGPYSEHNVRYPTHISEREPTYHPHEREQPATETSWFRQPNPMNFTKGGPMPMRQNARSDAEVAEKMRLSAAAAHATNARSQVKAKPDQEESGLLSIDRTDPTLRVEADLAVGKQYAPAVAKSLADGTDGGYEFNLVDVDHNGTISRAEFIEAYGEEAAIKEFDKVDINKDGELQAGEYMAEYGKEGRERLLRSVHYGIAPEEHPIPNMDFDYIMSKPWNYKVKHPTKTGFRKQAAKVEVDLASIVAQYSTGIREPYSIRRH